MPILIYGATGYTGRLCAAEAKARGIEAILAGRDAAKVRAVAEPLGFEAAAVDLSDRARLFALVGRAHAVLHIAGPYSVTAEPMLEACLEAGVHYLDVNGEFRVLERIAARDGDAKLRKIMLLPSAGFGVVPTDCLLAHVAARATGASELSLVVDWRGGASRGTLVTSAEILRDGVQVCRDGALVPVERPLYRDFQLNDGRTRCVAFNFGDLFTAHMSTGIGNVTVYFPARSEAGRLAAMPPLLRRLIATGAGQAALRGVFRLMPAGPAKPEQSSATATLIAVAEGGSGDAAAKLVVPHPYWLTARTAVDLALRAAAGEAEPGYQTPSKAFGADYILGFAGVTRTDLDRV
jgi:short subunit dehydrogenase-like uncharacterized protein